MSHHPLPWPRTVREASRPAAGQLVTVTEHTGWGALRWQASSDGRRLDLSDARLDAAVVHDPAYTASWRHRLLRALWDHPRPSSVDLPLGQGLVLMVTFWSATVLLGPYLSGPRTLLAALAAALFVTVGLPDAARRLTHRRVRICPPVEHLADVIAAQQTLSAVLRTAGGDRAEFQQAVRHGHRLLWQAADLADDPGGSAARELADAAKELAQGAYVLARQAQLLDEELSRPQTTNRNPAGAEHAHALDAAYAQTNDLAHAAECLAAGRHAVRAASNSSEEEA